MSYVFLNGAIIPEEEAKISVFDHGFLYGDAVYDTLRGYYGKAWNLDAHLDRLFEGCNYLKITPPFSKEEIKKHLETLLTKNRLEQSRIRILISRGINNYNFSTSPNPTIMISAIPITIFPTETASLITLDRERPMAHIKSTSMVITNMIRQEAEAAKAVDAIIINRHGHATEGSICNFFIIKDGTLITSKEDSLAGTTQKIVLDLASKLGIPTEVRNITKDEIFSADEIFITSVLKLILPIDKVDSTTFANSPGPITLKLKEAITAEFEKFKQSVPSEKNS